MIQFVFAYNRRSGGLLIDEQYVDGDPTALDRRFELEKVYANDDAVEVVVLTAESRAALASTHGRYFRTLRELAERR